jgi:hemerythrin-like domain-containing protein
MNPAEILRRQHFLILRGVVLTRRIAQRVFHQVPGCAQDVAELVSFFRVYLLDFHARLENDLVFPWLQASHRLPIQFSLSDLRSEHDCLRRLTDEVDWAVQSDHPANPGEVAKVLEVHAGITEHHVRRENHSLLPLLESGAEDTAFMDRIRAFLDAARPLDAQISESLEKIEARLPQELSPGWQ